VVEFFFIQKRQIQKIMKTVKIIIIAILAIVITSNVYSQSSTIKTETIKVSGNCDMCKARIEKAAKVDGVSKAEWNKETKLLAVTYDPAKTNSDAIGKKVAAAGHDTEKTKADAKAYDKLPSCCKYR
jgi:periplasmic mercuric ion binding protein